MEKNIKIFVSGSSSLEIRSKIKEFLTGRKRETHLLPLSFSEIVADEKKLPDTLQGITLSEDTIDQWRRNDSIYGAYLSRKIAETAIYGGYPAVYLSENDEERREVLAEIYNSYVRKDVINLMNIEKVDIFMKLVHALSSQVGNLINKSEICSLIGSNAVTITKFINILKGTYITWYLPQYVSAIRNEIISAHKCFFVDNGLRNFSVRQFSSLSNRPDKRVLLENLVFTEILKKCLYLMSFISGEKKPERKWILYFNKMTMPSPLKLNQDRQFRDVIPEAFIHF